jgi:hypothetical protein
MMDSYESISAAVRISLFGLGGLAAIGVSGQAQTIPSATAIPVVFVQTVAAGKAKPGEIVTAKTSQVVFLPDGQVLRSGSTVIGHVVESKRFVSNHATNEPQSPSALSVHFDKIAEGGSTIPLSLSMRAIAGPVASHEASIPHYRDETDSTGMRTLIGGDQFSPLGKEVLSSSGEVVGFNRKDGVFARLIAADSAGADSVVHCAATDTEQSLGVFSARACGAYDLDGDSISKNGAKGSGTFALESRHESVKLYANSAALLQVVSGR